MMVHRRIVLAGSLLVFCLTASSQTRIPFLSANSGVSMGAAGSVSILSALTQPMVGSSSGNGVTVHSSLGAYSKFLSVTTSVGRDDGTVPAEYSLSQNFPNPFNPVTTIRYGIPAAGRVTLTVYDILGRTVAVLVDAIHQPGRHDATFDGMRYSSGVYFYRIQAGDFQSLKKMVMLK
jgi:hypothetical protein